MFVCKRCGCEDQKFFGKRKGKIYCRRCISFPKQEVSLYQLSNIENVQPSLDYSLTKEQFEISRKVSKAIIEQNKNVLIYAVCGAGKTEIVFEVISEVLNQKKQVGFCIPRKDVVIELEDRIKKAFPLNKVVSIYGGHTKELTGDIILLTTHQLYRYSNYFDLLIIDETDAFPFSNNEVLMNMFSKSIKGNYIMMSATPLEWMVKKIEEENGIILSLMKRFHGHKIVEPTLVIKPFDQEGYIVNKLKEYKNEGKKCLVFTPTRTDCKKLFSKLNKIVKKGNYVHSKKEEREKIIEEFKEGKYDYLVTTSILERGITIKNLQVIVYDASHYIYNAETLIQISGRVGRKKDSYTGDVIFLAKKSTIYIQNSISKIKEANKYGML